MTKHAFPKAMSLADFGWTPFFQSQLDIDELSSLTPVRIASVHRGHLDIIGPEIQRTIAPFADEESEGGPTVGDWILIHSATHRPQRILNRASLFKRRAAGTSRQIQLIAANVDTLLIVSSCNQDFNVARLERYLALARDAQVTPVIVLTKADLTENAEDFANQARSLLPGLLVEVVDARSKQSLACLESWCGPGQTLAVVGSSGVGKSTLTNTLRGTDDLATQAIREDDAKGRHTTTSRALHCLPTGAWLIDTPGMRELQLTDVQSGIEDVFSDIVALAATCRFSDCEHESEPGCAVLKAIETGDLEAKRFKRYRKLLAEEVFNTESLAERRARFKAFGKMTRNSQKNKKLRRDGP